MIICAALLVAGSVLSALTINNNVLSAAPDHPVPTPECRINLAVSAPPLETGRVRSSGPPLEPVPPP